MGYDQQYTTAGHEIGRRAVVNILPQRNYLMYHPPKNVEGNNFRRLKNSFSFLVIMERFKCNLSTSIILLKLKEPSNG